VIDATGARTAVREVQVNYQAVADGGCITTTSEPGSTPGSFVQRTGTARRTAQGTVLRSP
jgi:hypothetical protein